MKLIALLILFTFAQPAAAIELPVHSTGNTITEIIQGEKQFAFTDGSSYYILKADCTFSSRPVLMSGIQIRGTWKATGGGVYVIDGQWKQLGLLWGHGGGDFRRMTMILYPPSAYEMVSNAPDISKIYKIYFVIDELIKVRKQVELPSHSRNVFELQPNNALHRTPPAPLP